MNQFFDVYNSMHTPRNSSRLNQQKKQINALLVDFQKARNKCLKLASELRVDINQDDFYPNTERTTKMKCQLLDLKGLVQLKNSLVNILNDLFEKEHQFLYKKQKLQAQREAQIENFANERSPKKKIETNVRQSRFQSMRSSKMSDIRSSRNVEVPFYKLDQDAVETVETKLDRISKFIASLKKSMRSAVETSAGWKFKTKQYLLEQELYIKAKAELERYLMREEQLERLMNSAIRTQLQEHFNSNASLSPDGQYYLVKVPKPKKQNPEQSAEQSDQFSPLNSSKNNVRNFSPNEDDPMSRLEAKVDADFEQIKVELEKKTQNFTELFSQMNQAVEKGSERLSELRQKRKLAFEKDDELWDQL